MAVRAQRAGTSPRYFSGNLVPERKTVAETRTCLTTSTSVLKSSVARRARGMIHHKRFDNFRVFHITSKKHFGKNTSLAKLTGSQITICHKPQLK